MIYIFDIFIYFLDWFKNSVSKKIPRLFVFVNSSSLLVGFVACVTEAFNFQTNFGRKYWRFEPEKTHTHSNEYPNETEPKI